MRHPKMQGTWPVCYSKDFFFAKRLLLNCYLVIRSYKQDTEDTFYLQVLRPNFFPCRVLVSLGFCQERRPSPLRSGEVGEFHVRDPIASNKRPLLVGLKKTDGSLRHCHTPKYQVICKLALMLLGSPDSLSFVWFSLQDSEKKDMGEMSRNAWDADPRLTCLFRCENPALTALPCIERYIRRILWMDMA